MLGVAGIGFCYNVTMLIVRRTPIDVLLDCMKAWLLRQRPAAQCQGLSGCSTRSAVKGRGLVVAVVLVAWGGGWVEWSEG